MEKTLKINVPEGYEIDKEKSTFDNIVFKKLPLQKIVSIKWNKNYNGVEIHADGEHFVVDANPSYYMFWDDATRFYNNSHRSHTWKLPTIKQLKVLVQYRDTINQIIVENKGFEIFGCLWSCEEKDEFCTWGVYMDDGFANYFYKSNYRFVRAVSAL